MFYNSSFEYSVTSESVAPGHPDKVADFISDSLLDHFLTKDSNSRVALECMVVCDKVFVGGEVSCDWNVRELEEVVRSAVRKIRYVNNSAFNADNIKIEFIIGKQSEDIAVGLRSGKSSGAGDQGIMYGYATKEVPDMIPAPLYYSHRILKNIMKDIDNDVIEDLGSDAKSQVTLKYQGDQPVKVENIVLSIQHDAGMSVKEVTDIVLPYIVLSFPKDFIDDKSKILINPTGIFNVGGPVCDCGLTGRKLMVDTYGGVVPHGGGGFSGKDCTKVDRSGAYMARYVAKNIVASGIASKCLVKLAYAIGVAEPLDFAVSTFGTSKVHDDVLTNFVREAIGVTPYDICESLSLKKPVYARTSCYGHFGREPDTEGGFSWEHMDFAKIISSEFSYITDMYDVVRR